MDTLLKRAVFRRYSARRRAIIWPEETQCRVVRCEKNAWRQVVALQASVTDAPGKRKGGNTSLMVEHVIDQYALKGYLLTVVLGDGDLIVRSLSLPTASRKEAGQSVAWSGMILDSAEEYVYDAVRTGEEQLQGEYTWLAAAYPAKTVESVIRCCREKGCLLDRIDILPALIGKLYPSYEGSVSITDDGKRHITVLNKRNVCAYTCEDDPGVDHAVVLPERHVQAETLRKKWQVEFEAMPLLMGL